MMHTHERDLALATSTREEMCRALAERQRDEALVSICIVTANRVDDTVVAIESALAQDDDGPREIVVVDNASTDDTVARLRARFPQITVVASPVNLGCPAGRNLAMLVAGGSWFLHLDDDGTLAPDAVRVARQRAAEYTDAAVLMFNVEERGCNRLVAPSGTLLPDFSGCANMMRRAALCQSGLFAPEFLRQGEERDLLLRLFELNWTVRYCDDVHMLHRPRHRVGAAAAATTRMIEQHRIVNESLTALKHLPWSRAPFVVAWHTAGYVVRSVQRGHPADIVNLRHLIRRAPAAIGDRWPCAAGSRRLRHLSNEFQARRWPTWVPLSHDTPTHHD